MITQVRSCHRRQPALTLPATTLCLRDVRRPATVHVARADGGEDPRARGAGRHRQSGRQGPRVFLYSVSSVSDLMVGLM